MVVRENPDELSIYRSRQETSKKEREKRKEKKKRIRTKAIPTFKIL